jgi:hypothetical protein
MEIEQAVIKRDIDYIKDKIEWRNLNL